MNNDSTPFDETLRQLTSTAEMDQAIAGMKQMAHSVSAYYHELRAHGFTRDQALALTLNMQSEVFRMASRGKGGQP